MDIIFLEGLKLKAIIGVNPWEREVQQTLLLDVRCECDISKAAKTDDVAHALNYDELKRIIEKFSEAANYQLIESFAENLVNTLFETFEVLQGVTLRLNKPGAVAGVSAVGLEIYRKLPAPGIP